MVTETETAQKKHAALAASLFNLPNKLTSLRLVLSFVLFVAIWLQQWPVSLVVFVAAAITDWLDGYFARKRGLTSSLGRVYDPLVDKILVCGTFIFFLSEPAANLNPWMVTIIVAREFLVTAVRGFLENKGVTFGADWFGKIKMVLQCAAIVWILFLLTLASYGVTRATLDLVRDVLNWTTVAATFFSGANYVRRAVQHLG